MIENVAIYMLYGTFLTNFPAYESTYTFSPLGVKAHSMVQKLAGFFFKPAQIPTITHI